MGEAAAKDGGLTKRVPPGNSAEIESALDVRAQSWKNKGRCRRNLPDGTLTRHDYGNFQAECNQVNIRGNLDEFSAFVTFESSNFLQDISCFKATSGDLSLRRYPRREADSKSSENTKKAIVL